MVYKKIIVFLWSIFAVL